MTWDEIKASNKLILTAQDVAPVLECDPQTLRLAVREQKDLIGFNCSMIGKTLRIPRMAFIRWMEGGDTKMVFSLDKKGGMKNEQADVCG